MKRNAMLAALVMTMCALPRAQAASTPSAVTVSLNCAGLKSCNGLNGWFQGRMDFTSGGVLLFSETGQFYAQHGVDKTILVTLSGNGNQKTFDGIYGDPQSSLFAAPDLNVTLLDGQNAVLVPTARYQPVASALWARHSEDSAALQSQIDAERASRIAADTSIQNSLSSEIARASGAESLLASGLAQEAAARQGADASLLSMLNAETVARLAGEIANLAAANGYTDAHTPWQPSCPVGQTNVAIGPGTWACQAAGGGSFQQNCPPNEFNISQGNGKWVCGAICNNVISTLTSDASNCGACGHVCSMPNAASNCVDSACTLGACNAGFSNCDGQPGNGCEVDLNSDSNNCAACGHVCPQNAAHCISGVCKNIDTSNVFAQYTSEGRGVYLFKTPPCAPLAQYTNFCQQHGMQWWAPKSQADAQQLVTYAFNLDHYHTWVQVFGLLTTLGSIGGYQVQVDSPGCVAGNGDPNGFGAFRKWGCSFCLPPQNGNQSCCWDGGSHQYDWFVCQAS